jgi:hypothetical protein
MNKAIEALKAIVELDDNIATDFRNYQLAVKISTDAIAELDSIEPRPAVPEKMLYELMDLAVGCGYSRRDVVEIADRYGFEVK